VFCLHVMLLFHLNGLFSGRRSLSSHWLHGERPTDIAADFGQRYGECGEWSIRPSSNIDGLVKSRIHDVFGVLCLVFGRKYSSLC
jgi:hypothetical protein